MSRMHRELSHADGVFHQENRLSLYLLTALLGLLIGLDLSPLLAGWLGSFGLALPTWPRTFPLPFLRIEGSFALIAAVLGGARILYGSLDSLLEGRVGADLALAIACVAAILLGEPLVAAEVVFIGLLGESLEHYTLARTQNALRGLAELTPKRCWLLRAGREARGL